MVAFFLSACQSPKDDQANEKIERNSTSTDELCSIETLHSTSAEFLKTLNRADVSAASSFYYPTSLAENGDLIAYTFFPNLEPNSIFDYSQKKAESPFIIEPFGEYINGSETGNLVMFVQKKHKSKLGNDSFLTDKKFDAFFVCHFQCISGKWKITRNACFQDSGGPFHASIEDNR